MVWNNKPESEELTQDIYNNQDNKDFKITINKKTYDLKNAKIFWTEVTTHKISKNETNKIVQKIYTKIHWCTNKRKK